jgi:hypothetical protein
VDRVLKQAPATLQVLNYDDAGNLLNVAGVWTATVVDSAGVAIAGSPLAVTNPAVGTYEAVLPAQTVLDTYDVTWNVPDGSKRSAQFEVVGSFLFTLAELRAFEAGFTDVAAYPVATLVGIRSAVEERFEEVTHVSWTLRGRREFLSGEGRARIFPRSYEIRRLVSARMDGVALSAGDLADVAVFPFGMLERKTGGVWNAGARNIEVLYEHGWPVPPMPIKRAGMRLARSEAIKTILGGSNERATAEITEMGSFRLSIAGREGPTGIPDVDAVLDQFGKGEPGWFA